MAETLLFSVAGKLLGDLSSLALQELGLLWGVKNEIEKLQNTVSTIKAVLLDAEEKQTNNHEIRDWLGKLEVALYEADDLLDDFSTEALRRKIMTQDDYKMAKKVRVFFSSSNQLAFRFKMGHKLKGIREKLNAIAADRTNFHFTELQERVEKKMVSRDFVPVKNVIGREDDKNAIIELLLNSNNVQENVSTVSIVGIGGLGKTTLADLVYNDENLVRHFELRMWVCVSDVFDVKIIAKNIIGSATKEKCEINQMKEIIDKLKKEIEGKKYLLVLDDVWNEERNKWLDLKQLLMDGAKGSKILVTTRIPVVARVMDTVSPYNLKGLSEIDSWSLFKQIAFENGVEPKNTNHVAIGKKIVKKCVQVPLAIQTVGALLYIRETEKEWQDVLDNKLSKIASPDQSDIFTILKLSYDHLQPHLKKCFAFCSVFPKDYRIETRTLIQLWVAQGFVQLSDNSQRVEEVGEQYFKDLLSRSFFQDVETNEFTGDAVSCKMHDLVHDFAQSIVGNEICIINSDAKEVDARTRHVFVDSDQESLGEIPARLLEASKLRTLLFSERWGTSPSSEITGMSESTCNKTISSFKRVRVLGLQYREILRVPNSIGKLRLVRNLDLSGNHFESLPECICGLLTLESLNLSTCMFLKSLPRQIKKLVRLRHLNTHHCFNLKYMPRGLGQLTSLERLSWFALIPPIFYELNIASGLSELQRLVNIRGELKITELIGCTLEIRKESGSSYYLSGMKFLDSLGLWWSLPGGKNYSLHGDENYDDQLTLFESLRPHSNLKELEIRFYAGVDFPSWMTVDIVLFLPNLAHVQLDNCGKCQNLPPFGLLPSLRVLELDFLQSLEYIYKEEEGKNCGDFASSSSSLKAQQLFPSLEKLILSRLKQLKGLGSRRRRTRGREEGVTTASSSAAEILFSCSNRVTQHFPSLVELNISDCPLLDFSADDDENSRQFQTLGTLTSLQEIYIDDCGSMTSLPDSMRQLTELKHLNVRKCPQLIPRCKKETGEDWPKIAHIPYIDCKVPEPEEYESSVVDSFNTETDGY